MNPILLIIVKLLASSALLTAFYFVLFRGKSSYTASRIFLLCIPVLSAVFSLVSIEAGQAGLPSFSSLVEQEQSAPAVQPSVPPVAAIPAPATVEYVATGETDAIYSEVPPFVGRTAKPALSHRTVALVVWLVAILIFTSVLVRQMYLLGRIRRRAELCVVLGEKIWFSRDIKSAFSVMRSIYVGTGTTEDKLAIVVRHEKEHIARRHYIDLALMEFFTVILWFNPFVWLARRELRTVHEFQADRGTLESGVDMHDYMLAILEETTGVIPVMANGLQSSMIKKRFLKMKTENKIRLRVLRAALTVPFAAALMLFFAFRPAAPAPYTAPSPLIPAEHEAVTVPAVDTPDTTEPETSGYLLGKDLTVQETEPVSPEKITAVFPVKDEDMEIVITGPGTSWEVRRRDTLQTAGRPSRLEKNFQELFEAIFDKANIDINSLGETTEPVDEEMRHIKDRLELRMKVFLQQYENLSITNKELVSKIVGIIEEARKAGLSDSQILAWKETEDKTRKAPNRRVTRTEEKVNGNIKTITTDTWEEPMVNVSKEEKKKEEKPDLTVSDFPEGYDFARHGITVGPDGVLLTPDGLPVGNSRFFEKWDAKYISNKRVFVNFPTRQSQIIRIERGKNETRVTEAVHIYHDSNWTSSSKNECLIDPETGDRYMVRDVVGDEELGRISIVRGLAGKVYERTSIFPPLPKKVKIVDVGHYYADGETPPKRPDNAANIPFEKGIVIDDYAPPKSAPKGKIIR